MDFKFCRRFLYFIETFGKIIKIIDDMKAGKNAETAVYNVQKTLFDYSLVPPRIRQVRQSPFGVPFLTFQYKVLPFHRYIYKTPRKIC